MMSSLFRSTHCSSACASFLEFNSKTFHGLSLPNSSKLRSMCVLFQTYGSTKPCASFLESDTARSYGLFLLNSPKLKSMCFLFQTPEHRTHELCSVESLRNGGHDFSPKSKKLQRVRPSFSRNYFYVEFWFNSEALADPCFLVSNDERHTLCVLLFQINMQRNDVWFFLKPHKETLMTSSLGV
jgi:hypothetical protein